MLVDYDVRTYAHTHAHLVVIQVIQLEAVMDDISELAELFRVVLREPISIGRLSTNSTEAQVEILPNQDPHGVLQLAPVSMPLLDGVVSVEETVGLINYQVNRTSGVFGDITVAVETSPRTATSADGELLCGLKVLSQRNIIIKSRIFCSVFFCYFHPSQVSL